MTKITKMTKKQIVYFYTYIACIIIIPVVLSLIADSIPKNDSLSPSGHPFECIDDRAFFIWLGLDLGLYLYPLHIFINKTTLKISKSLFLPSIIFAILLPPAVLILSDASAREFFFIFMSYVVIAFVIPFLIIYYIKRKI
ncbi:hypothetical protein [Gardnerella vaginalis]|uniref:hypothetical protein n=1 Tax=Gardnerella vaginalis TaxID=2702 RepID=UPI0039EE3054